MRGVVECCQSDEFFPWAEASKTPCRPLPVGGVSQHPVATELAPLPFAVRRATSSTAVGTSTGPKGTPEEPAGGKRASKMPPKLSNKKKAYRQQKKKLQDARRLCEDRRQKVQERERTAAGGFTKVGRLAFRFMHGNSALATGTCDTCLPDALMAGMAALGLTLPHNDAYSIIPSQGDAHVHAAQEVLSKYGCALAYCREAMTSAGGPELHVLRFSEGVYIIYLRVVCEDGSTDRHFVCLNATTGHVLDNDQHKRVLRIDDADRSSSSNARKLFKYFFMGAKEVHVRAAYQLVYERN